MTAYLCIPTIRCAHCGACGARFLYYDGMTRYRWAGWGDINAFFGLMLDNVAVMIALVAITTIEGGFSREFVYNHMLPGSAIGVLIGDLVYTWLAFRLARRTARSDVTAMPLGIDTPSTFAVAGLVLLPALRLAQERHHLSHEQAMYFAWHVAAMVLVLSGLFKTLIAPIGNLIRRVVPRAGLLGSLAAIAITLIAFVPMWQHIAVVPIVGMLSLTVILVALIAHRELPGNIPGALVAVALGVIVFYVCDYLGSQYSIRLVPTHGSTQPVSWRLPMLPSFTHEMDWWRAVFVQALSFLPIMLPFALATVVGGIDCTESAAAAGDEYDTRSILLTEGVASFVAGLCGGVLQNTPYIGQPAYKAMGGRAAYTLATALFVGVAGCFGLFATVFAWLPEPAMFGILVFVGLEITAQSFRATTPRHYPAVALAVIPALAYMATIPVDMALAGRSPPEAFLPIFQALRSLANGFIITSLLWASALAAILDNRLRGAALFVFLAALASLVGIIHSPLNPAQILWPASAIAEWRAAYDDRWNETLMCQSPYVWAAAYALSGAVLLLLSLQRHSPVSDAEAAR